MVVKRAFPGLAVLLSLTAAVFLAPEVVAQDLSDDDEGGITLGEKVETKKKLTPEEIAEKAKADKEARVLARLKASVAEATDPNTREKLQKRVLENLSGLERIDYAISIRDGKETSEKMRLDMYRWLAGEVRVTFGIWGTLWYRKYCENYADADLERLEKEYFKSLEALEKPAANEVYIVSLHAQSLLYRYTRKGDRADAEKALKLFDREIALRKEAKDNSPEAYALGTAWWGKINCHFALGGTNDAVAAIHQFQKTGLKVACNRGQRGYMDMMNAALSYLEREPLDVLKLPFYTESKAFPEPQQADYTETFAAAPAVRIEAKGIAPDDPRFRLLKVKYGRYGIAFRDDAPFVVSVEVDSATKIFDDLKDPAAFRKLHEGKEFEEKAPTEFRDYMAAEGYVLEVTEKGATIKAKTKQGALWGIVSLIQMTDRGKKAVRVAKLRDWPDVERRGNTGSWWAPTLEYMLFQKLNTVDHQRHPCFENHFEPLSWHMEAAMGRQFHEFGLELFYGMCWVTHAPQIPMAYPRTLPYRVEVMKRYAKEHIGVYYPLDDVRFPVEKVDLEKFGSAAAIDGKHQSAIYREVTKEYPDWRFIVCAPFYWGPTGRCHFYPEQRDPYLAQWSKDLDPGIEVYWTGGRVKSCGIPVEHLKWALKAYGKRPYLFQNALGTGAHNLLDYTVDAQNWPNLYGKGLLDKGLKGYHLNCHTPINCGILTTLAGALWNIAGYSAEETAKRGIRQLMGEKMFDYLREGYDDLCYFDKYRYGSCGDEVLAEDGEDLERRVANIDQAWKKANDYAKEIGSRMYGYYGNGVRYAHKVLDSFRAPRDFDTKYKGLLEETRSFAKNDTRFNDEDKGDAYFAPTRLNGGVIVPLYKTAPDTPERAKDHPRLTVELFGADAKPKLRTLSGSFDSASFPPGDDYLLCLSAAGTLQLRIKVNEKVVFEGKKPFGQFPKNKIATFKIPAKILKRANSFTIENLSKEHANVSYVVVLTTGRIRSALMADEDSGLEL